MKEQDKLKQLYNDLNHAHVNNVTLKYNTNPTFVLASVCLVMFDKLNECIDRINIMESKLNEIQRSKNQSKI